MQVQDLKRSAEWCMSHRAALPAQEDVFVPTLDARETLQFAARLRLPESLAASQREERIDSVLRIMGLTEQEHTQVRG